MRPLAVPGGVFAARTFTGVTREEDAQREADALMCVGGAWGACNTQPLDAMEMANQLHLMCTC